MQVTATDIPTAIPGLMAGPVYRVQNQGHTAAYLVAADTDPQSGDPARLIAPRTDSRIHETEMKLATGQASLSTSGEKCRKAMAQSGSTKNRPRSRWALQPPTKRPGADCGRSTVGAW